MGKQTRIAMWSGPRNISTAMMRSFGARADAIVVDEPFYAAYLDRTGLEHPMRAEIIADGETDADKVAAWLSGPLPEGKSVFYQKHMTHHMIPSMPRGWIDKVENAFLIREPERVLASYVVKRESVELTDIGFVAQAEIFGQVADRLGKAPPVIAASDVRANPRSTLAQLCERLGIAFDDAMLSWKPGIHESDGIALVSSGRAIDRFRPASGDRRATARLAGGPATDRRCGPPLLRTPCRPPHHAVR